MKTLISKLQFHYFEKGDFDKIENRTLNEILLFVHQFPWEEQRNGIFINLNGPSVTIENGKGAFLKVAVYYYGKFILYYLNESNHIYCRIADRLSDLDPNIEDFFNDRIKETDFNKYRDWLFHKRKYFATNKFEYRVSFWRALGLLAVPVFIGTTFLAAIIVNGIVSLIFLFPVLAFFSGVSLTLFLNYYFFTRNSYLKVSRGVDEFYFGKKSNIKRYSKKDIKTIRTYNNQAHRNPWSDFYIFEIELRNGEILKLTNLMISSFRFGEKFPEVVINNKHKAIPIVRKDNFKNI